MLPFLLSAGSALAVDGVLEINNARAVAGGVTPGDTPDYPVTIDQPGSYRLTGDLFVSGTNRTVVQITADDVTLDLNGFSVRCLFLFTPCAGNGTGIGIDAVSAKNVTVRNGNVLDMSSHGLFMGVGSRVSGINASNNGAKGIRVALDSSVTQSSVLGNGATGIDAGGGSRVAENVVEGNGHADGQLDAEGINCGNYCVVQDNIVKNSTGHGIDTASTSTVRGNTVAASGGHGIVARGGSTVVENSISASGRCGLRGGGETGYANNVLTFNNGTVITENLAVANAIETGTNICGSDTDCSEGAVNQCN